jgi:hypothetical protein
LDIEKFDALQHYPPVHGHIDPGHILEQTPRMKPETRAATKDLTRPGLWLNAGIGA